MLIMELHAVDGDPAAGREIRYFIINGLFSHVFKLHDIKAVDN